MGIFLHEIQLLSGFYIKILVRVTEQNKKVRNVQVFSIIQAKTAKRSWLGRVIIDEKIRIVLKIILIQKLSTWYYFRECKRKKLWFSCLILWVIFCKKLYLT